MTKIARVGEPSQSFYDVGVIKKEIPARAGSLRENNGEGGRGDERDNK